MNSSFSTISLVVTWAAFLLVLSNNGAVVMAKLIDLSHEHSPTTLMSPGLPSLNTTVLFDGDYLPGVYVKFSSYSIGEHGGTHIDVPKHFNKDGNTLEQFALEDVISPGVMIDCSEETSKDSVYSLPLSKLQEWESEHGQIPNQAAVVINFNWSHKFNNATLYFGTDDVTNITAFRLPQISKEAGEWLVDKRDVKMLGVDTAGPDGIQAPFSVHNKMLKGARPRIIIENMKDVSQLPAKGFRLFAAPVKFVEGTGVQVRVFAETGLSSATKSFGNVIVMIVGLAFVFCLL